MFSEILKIIPQLEKSELNKMERTLNTRFKRIAKRFGQGINMVVKGAGLAGLAVGLIDKFLNPLKETQEAIERLLNQSADISTNSEQFNTTTGKLFKLIQLAKSKGIDQDSLFGLMGKYQVALANAKVDPNTNSAKAVKNFSNDSDIAESFFSFIQSLQKMNTQQQILVQQAVFGEKQILKLGDFLRTDQGQRFKELGLDKVSTAKLTNSIDKMNTFSDLAEVLTAKRETEDFLNKSAIVTKDMIMARDKSERIQLERERERIQNFENLAKVSQTTDQIMVLVEKGVTLVGEFIGRVTPAIESLVLHLKKLTESRLVRGIFGRDK